MKVRISRSLFTRLLAGIVGLVLTVPALADSKLDHLTEKEIYYKNNHLYVNNTDPENPIYKRYNIETDTFDAISIFDDENCQSEQYGANQMDFEMSIEKLKNDPRMVEELQKYFPISDFSSEELAYYFYNKYLTVIAKHGCGYAAAANRIMRMFEGHEYEFEATFGFPMYEVNNSDIDFNYELLALKFFNFYNIDCLKLKKTILKSMEKDLLDEEIRIFKRDTNSNLRTKKRLTAEEVTQLMELNHEIQKELDKLVERHDKASNKYIDVAIPNDSSFGYIVKFLKAHKVNINVKFFNSPRKYNVDDIIACDKFTLEMSSDYAPNYSSDYKDYHYMYVKDVLEDGSIIVSTWGQKYIITIDKRSTKTSTSIKTR